MTLIAEYQVQPTRQMSPYRMAATYSRQLDVLLLFIQQDNRRFRQAILSRTSFVREMRHYSWAALGKQRETFSNFCRELLLGSATSWDALP